VTSNENVPIKPSANEQATDPRNNTPMVNNQVIPGQVVAVPIVYNQLPVQIFGDEIQAKIMTSHYCYIKQDLESFFSACLGCCADFFKYKVYVTNESKTEIDKIDGAIFRVTENEDFCMRMNCFCSQFCKPGSLYIRPLNSDNIVAHFHFHIVLVATLNVNVVIVLVLPTMDIMVQKKTINLVLFATGNIVAIV
jgi:hypothetical protein